MRLRVMSDVHLEFGKLRIKPVECDAVILAGDIGPGLSGAAWALASFPGMPVIYVPGNHEFYGSRAMEDLEDALEVKCRGTNVFLCRDPGRRVDIGDVRILASTLWTNFAIGGNAAIWMALAKMYMNDFQNIPVRSWSTHPGGGRFTPEAAVTRHKEAVAWLKGELMKPWPGKTVLVTHHAPTLRSLEAVERDPWACCYASDREDLLVGVDLAIHGHIHRRLDYRIGATRVVTNARGYVSANEAVVGFDLALVVEV